MTFDSGFFILYKLLPLTKTTKFKEKKHLSSFAVHKILYKINSAYIFKKKLCTQIAVASVLNIIKVN